MRTDSFLIVTCTEVRSSDSNLVLLDFLILPWPAICICTSLVQLALVVSRSFELESPTTINIHWR